MNEPTPSPARITAPAPARARDFPRPLRVLKADPLDDHEPWHWFCRRCYDAGVRDLYVNGAGGYAPDQHEANTAARRHWNRCPHTAAAFRRMIAAAHDLEVAAS